MYKVKEIYEINGKRYPQILEMCERRFISRFRTLNGRTPRWTCCDDIYNINKRENDNFIIFDCELVASNIIERYYFKKDDLKKVGLI